MTEPLPLRAFTPLQRAAAVLLQAVAAANLLELGLRLALDQLAPVDAERAPLPLLVQRVFFTTVVPWLILRLLSLLASAKAAREGGALVITTLRERLEVPLASVAAVEPLWPPLPAPGVRVRLRSGRPLDVVLTTPDLAALFALLRAEPSALGPVRDAAARKRTSPLRSPWLQLGLVPAAVTFVLFRLHQIITFGGLLGELHTLGLRSWLHTLTGVALYVFAHLLVIAGCLRALAGAASWTASRLFPGAAGPVRLAAEGLAALAYDGGIAAVLLLRLLA